MNGWFSSNNDEQAIKATKGLDLFMVLISNKTHKVKCICEFSWIVELIVFFCISDTHKKGHYCFSVQLFWKFKMSIITHLLFHLLNHLLYWLAFLTSILFRALSGRCKRVSKRHKKNKAPYYQCNRHGEECTERWKERKGWGKEERVKWSKLIKASRPSRGAYRQTFRGHLLEQ